MPALCCCHNNVEVDLALVVGTLTVTLWIIVCHVDGLWLWQLDTAQIPRCGLNSLSCEIGPCSLDAGPLLVMFGAL